MQIIPALYIKDGKLAVYKPGDYQNIDFLDVDPYDFIEKLNDLDIGNVGLVDVDSTLGISTNTGKIASLANTCIATLHVGGGIRNMDYLKELQYAGVDYFILGSSLYEKPEFLQQVSQAEDVKNEKITISIDILDGKVTYHGWTRKVDMTVSDIISSCTALGFSRFLINDVGTHEMHTGPNLGAYKKVLDEFPDIQLGSSGRINSMEDIADLSEIGVDFAIVGDKIYKEEGLLEKIAAHNEEHYED
jgi:phosphoribosylformimino-5-aminoimidazole carboxamide ribotide isomerase